MVLMFDKWTCQMVEVYECNSEDERSGALWKNENDSGRAFREELKSVSRVVACETRFENGL
jgi:hypothetical protein